MVCCFCCFVVVVLWNRNCSCWYGGVAVVVLLCSCIGVGVVLIRGCFVRALVVVLLWCVIVLPCALDLVLC